MLRPNADDNLDPINLNKMPSLDSLGVDYRTGGNDLFLGHMSPTTSLVSYAILSILLALALRLLSFVIDPDTALTWASVAGVFLAAYAYVVETRPGRGSHRAALSWLLLGPAFWVGLQLAQSTALTLPAYALLAGVFWLVLRESHRVAEHFLYWSIADPRLKREEAAALEATWKGEAPGEIPDAVRPAVSRLVQYRRRRRGPVFLALGAGFLVVLLTLVAGRTVFAGMFGAFTVLAALVALAFLRTREAGLGRTIASTSDVLGNYFTYNEHGTEAPGVFRSPAGHASGRFSRLLQTLLLLTFIVVPASSYFPLTPLVSGSRPWADVYVKTHKKDFPEPAQLTSAQVRRDLTPDQRTNYEHETGDAKDDYLQEIAERRYKMAVAKQVTAAQDSVATAVSRSPEAWVWLAMLGAGDGKNLFVWAILLSIVLSIAVPPALFFFTTVVAAGPLIEALHRLKHSLDESEEGNPQSSNNWNTYVDRIQGSKRRVLTDDEKHDDERLLRDHLWLGTAVKGDYPVLLHRDVLHDHAWFLGNSGSGKTSLGLAPIITQLVRLAPKLFAEQMRRDAPSRKAKHLAPTTVVLDFKGENYLFQTVKKEAEDAGLPFQHFTNVSGQSTHAFNPFLQPYMENVTTEQKAALLLQSLGLEHGEGYGPSHFSLAHASVLTRTLTDNPDIQSFVELCEILDTPGKKTPGARRHSDDADDLFAIINSLATHNALNVVPGTPQKGREHDPLPQKLLDNGIDMQAALENPHVLYFYLPATLEEAAVRRIGRLILYMLLVAAETFERTHGHAPRVYVFIDEFQQIVSKNLQLFLRMARSKGLSMILSNQMSSDLKIHTDDLAPVVRGNTRFKQYFAASDLNLAKELVDGSGEASYGLWSHSSSDTPPQNRQTTDGQGFPRTAHTSGSTRETSTEREDIRPRLSKNDILDVTDHPTWSIVDIARGSGYSQFKGRPFILDTMYHIPLEEKEAREQTPWPEVEPGKTLKAGAKRPASPAPPRSGADKPQDVPAAPPKARSALDDALDSWQTDDKKGDEQE